MSRHDLDPPRERLLPYTSPQDRPSSVGSESPSIYLRQTRIQLVRRLRIAPDLLCENNVRGIESSQYAICTITEPLLHRRISQLRSPPRVYDRTSIRYPRGRDKGAFLLAFRQLTGNNLLNFVQRMLALHAAYIVTSKCHIVGKGRHIKIGGLAPDS